MLRLQERKKTAFIRHQNPDEFIAEERKKRSHMSHSVALLVLSSKADHIGLALPKSAWLKNDEHIIVPPQLRMAQSVLKQTTPFGLYDAHEHVQSVACIIAREFLNFSNLKEDFSHFLSYGYDAMQREKFLYVGSTRGDDCHEGHRVRYGKWVHWVAVRLSRTERAFRPDSQLYQKPQWCSANRVVTLKQAMAMSDRKSQMLAQAVLKYSEITGNFSKLAKAMQQNIAA